MKNFNTSILFLVFNRPDTTKKVFEKIREAKPPRLYVAADGPREERPGEENLCRKVREIATNVDWDCEVKTLFRDENLGCKHAVSSAIGWFFEQEEMGIILEDDCLPNDSFFQFCEELLHKYKDDEQVMTISGNNFQPKKRTDNSYYFSKYMHCWGWASWSRAWESFNLEMNKWPDLKKDKFLSTIFDRKKAQKYWENIFDLVNDNKIDSWGYIWQYSIWKDGGVNILPEKNLVTNIGFGPDATHTTSVHSDSSNLETESISFPLSHPGSREINYDADAYTQNHHYETPFYKRVLNKLKRELNL